MFLSGVPNIGTIWSLHPCPKPRLHFAHNFVSKGSHKYHKTLTFPTLPVAPKVRVKIAMTVMVFQFLSCKDQEKWLIRSKMRTYSPTVRSLLFEFFSRENFSSTKQVFMEPKLTDGSFAAFPHSALSDVVSPRSTLV